MSKSGGLWVGWMLFSVVFLISLAIASPALADSPIRPGGFELPRNVASPEDIAELDRQNSGNCFRTQYLMPRSRSVGSNGKWDVRVLQDDQGQTEPASVSAGQNIATFLRSKQVFAKYQRLLGVDPSRGRPVRIFIGDSGRHAYDVTQGGDRAGASDRAVYGLTATECGTGAARYAAVIWRDHLPAGYDDFVTAHELFHIFQGEIVRRYYIGVARDVSGSDGNWQTVNRRERRWVGRAMNTPWFEMTAEQAAVTVTGRFRENNDYLLFSPAGRRSLSETPPEMDRMELAYPSWRFVQILEALMAGRQVSVLRLEHEPSTAFGTFLKRSFAAVAKATFENGGEALDQPGSSASLGYPRTMDVVARELINSEQQGVFTGVSAFAPFQIDYNLPLNAASGQMHNRAMTPWSLAFLEFAWVHIADSNTYGPALGSSSLSTEARLARQTQISPGDEAVQTFGDGTNTVTLRTDRRMSFDVARIALADNVQKYSIKLTSSGGTSLSRGWYGMYQDDQIVPPGGPGSLIVDIGNPGSSQDEAWVADHPFDTQSSDIESLCIDDPALRAQAPVDGGKLVYMLANSAHFTNADPVEVTITVKASTDPANCRGHRKNERIGEETPGDF